MEMHSIAIIGAGLAGLITAIRLEKLGYQPVIIDSSITEAKGEIGGFAKFSGAKFSLPPAGMGLLNVTKTEDILWEALDNVSMILGLDSALSQSSADQSHNLENLRKYDSIVLPPEEIDTLLAELKQILKDRSIKIIQGYCTKIITKTKNVALTVEGSNKTYDIECSTLFYAGGRLNTDILLEAGISPTNNKGIDVGARIEFLTGSGLSKLREHGPDAKFIKDNCRTFCLNVPGEIFRYPFKNITVPGGIIASSLVDKSNVGLLYRSNEKHKILNRVIDTCDSISKDKLEYPYKAVGTVFGDAKLLMSEIYGSEITQKLEDFGKYVAEKDLINWDIEHYIHIPLIDWYWDTFSIKDSFITNNKSIYCVGDTSGHARGLLQAAISGWLAAEEFSHEA